jgi:purine-binding chemotaxis protein CheW
VETDPRHVLFRAGGERFALPLASVAVVVPPDPPFAHVPRTAPPVLGAMGLRGRVVAVVEMAPLLGLPAGKLAPGAGQVLVLERERRALGFLVDAVMGVEPIEPPATPGDGLPVKGLSAVRGSPVAILDPDALAAAAGRLFRGRPG